MNNQQFLKEIDKLNREFKRVYTNHMLKIYHAIMCDQIDLDTVEELCHSIGVDINMEYVEVINTINEQEGDDDE